jgi:hypothetical protein
MELKVLLTRISNGWHQFREENDGYDDAENLVRRTLTHEIPEILRDLDFVKNSNEKYFVKASAGQSKVTHGPHIEIMNIRITKTPQSGYYLVYLFSEDMQRLYLSLAFGVTEFKDVWSGGKHRNAMQKTSSLLRSKIDNLDNLPCKDLGLLNLTVKKTGTVADYQYSNIAAIQYKLDNLPEDYTLFKDLSSMLTLYEKVFDEHGPNLDHDGVIESSDPTTKKIVEKDFKLRKRKKTSSKTDSSIISSKKKYSKNAIKIGYEGELKVFELEKERLREAGRSDLEMKVVHLAAANKTPGYDIMSYNVDGTPRRIEVKSGLGKKSIFDLTRNEKNMAEKYGKEYVIAVVENVRNKPTVEFIVNPVGQSWWNKNNPSPFTWEVDLRTPYESDEEE